jgi:hypothetical protein
MAHGGPGIHIAGEGVVLRVDPRGAKASGGGFAASVQFYPGRRNWFLCTSKPQAVLRKQEPGVKLIDFT